MPVANGDGRGRRPGLGVAARVRPAAACEDGLGFANGTVRATRWGRLISTRRGGGVRRLSATDGTAIARSQLEDSDSTGTWSPKGSRGGVSPDLTSTLKRQGIEVDVQMVHGRCQKGARPQFALRFSRDRSSRYFGRDFDSTRRPVNRFHIVAVRYVAPSNLSRPPALGDSPTGAAGAATGGTVLVGRSPSP